MKTCRVLTFLSRRPVPPLDYGPRPESGGNAESDGNAENDGNR